MERRFDMTDFEQSLRDHADQFVMVPSKRVWQGIYNDLHPGSKWPSITVAVILLFTLISIGHLNNAPKQIVRQSTPGEIHKKINPIKQIASQSATSGIHSQAINSLPESIPSKINPSEPIKNKSNDLAETNTLINKKAVKNNSALPISSTSIEQSTEQPTKKVPARNKFESVASSDIKLANKTTATNLAIPANSTNHNFINQDFSGGKHGRVNSNSKSSFNNQEMDFNNDHATSKNEGLPITTNSQPGNLLEIFSLNPVQPIIIQLRNNEARIQSNSNVVLNLNKENIKEEKKPAKIHKKRKTEISWVYFVSPTVSTVSFNGKSIQPGASQNLTPNIIQPNGNRKNMLYNARLGFEAGTQMTYAFSKKWQFVTGANFSYSGYNIISNQVHPTFAYLMLKDEHTGNPYPKSYITHFGNGQGQNQITLSNSSLQASIPVGLQYILWANKNVKITIVPAIEPSIIVKSNAYIISADGRNYVSDPGLLRKFNLNGNFGSYVTFSSKKIQWQVGPSIRYQMLSTYKGNYPVREHLIDYGIRIGISK